MTARIVESAGICEDELVHTENGWQIARSRYTMVHGSPIGGSTV